MKRLLVALSALALLTAYPVLSAHAQSKPASVRGLWQVSMQGQGAQVIQNLAIEQKDGTISGTLKAPQGDAVAIRGTVTGQTISFTVRRHTPEGDVVQQFDGTVNGGSITGTVTQGPFHVGWTAARPKEQTAAATH